MSNQATPKKPISYNTIKDLYDFCMDHSGYFETLINKKDNLEDTLLKDGFVLSEKDCKSLKQRLDNKKMTDLALHWLGAGLDWEGSKAADQNRKDVKKRKAGRGGEKGPEDDNCHWDDTV